MYFLFGRGGGMLCYATICDDMRRYASGLWWQFGWRLLRHYHTRPLKEFFHSKRANRVAEILSPRLIVTLDGFRAVLAVVLFCCFLLKNRPIMFALLGFDMKCVSSPFFQSFLFIFFFCWVGRFTGRIFVCWVAPTGSDSGCRSSGPCDFLFFTFVFFFFKNQNRN